LTRTTPCPDESALLELLEGLVDERRREELLAHLDQCSACSRLIGAAGAEGSSASGSTGTTPGARGLVPEPAAVLPPGSRVGRYVVLDRLGAGGMGVVHAAYDPELDRKLALKLIAPRLLGSEQAAEHRARMVREAQAMARLQHSNVISVHDAGTFEGQVFLAMELFPGITLRAWLGQKQRTWREVRDVFLQAGRGLAAAHAAGLVHRDFKPVNAS
jgi:serine/threonine protein kinase